MSRIELRLRFESELPERVVCPLCGLAAATCDGCDDLERAFVCLGCRTEVVAVVVADPPAAARRTDAA